MFSAEQRQALADASAASGPILILTGAGISAESGIPTFRGPEGYWRVGSRDYRPEALATWQAFAAMPEVVWGWYLHRRGVCRRAVPNRAHAALAALEAALGERFALITQNVDGLHLRAGNSPARTLQVHGNLHFARCARECAHAAADLTFVVPEALTLDWPKDRLPTATELALLRCPRCGAPARPHVLWFDECYDEDLFRADTAMRAAADAEILIVVGTAGATNLPRQIADRVARLGRPIIDVNLDDNPFAAAARRTGGHALLGAAAELLPTLVQHMIATHRRALLT